jgi:hypothetical protein
MATVFADPARSSPEQDGETKPANGAAMRMRRMLAIIVSAI